RGIMANIAVKRADGATVYLKAAGAGTDQDPHVPEQSVTLSGSLPDTAAGDLAAMAAQLSGTLQTAVSSVAIPSAIYSGQKTVTAAGTAEALAVSQALTSGVTVKALASNTGVVYVGGSSVDSTNGFELAAGDQVFVEIANLATVYI